MEWFAVSYAANLRLFCKTANKSGGKCHKRMLQNTARPKAALGGGAEGPPDGRFARGCKGLL